MIAKCKRFPSYLFDTERGLVWSTRKGRMKRIGRGTDRGYGIPLSLIDVNRRKVQTYLHVAICEAAYGPHPEGSNSVRFLDGDRSNCQASNLRWETFESRLWAQIDTIPESGCWIFNGSNNGRNQYGRIAFNGTLQYAHRAAYVHYVGDPGGRFVCHKCDVPQCVNPGHLFLGTAQENADDMIAKGRASVGEDRPSAVLTEAQVVAIRRDPRSLPEIAADYGVSRSNIWCVKKRMTWRHVA